MGEDKAIGTVRWGILGTGAIAKAFASDLSFARNAQKTAVGSRTIGSAESFAEQYGFANAFGSYEELVHNDEVDAVYVATPHPFHKENTLAALRAGKAVLCEKPFTVNGAELEELVHYAKRAKAFSNGGDVDTFLAADS